MTVVVMEQVQQGDGTFEVETDDLRFQKTLEGEDGSIAEVRYGVRSLADDPLACRIRNRLPDGLTPEDVYVNPDDEDWDVIDDGAIVFEGQLAPGTGSSTTVTIRIEHRRGVDPLGPEPTIDIAKPQGRRANRKEDEGDSGDEPPATVPIEIPEDLDTSADEVESTSSAPGRRPARTDGSSNVEREDSVTTDSTSSTGGGMPSADALRETVSDTNTPSVVEALLGELDETDGELVDELRTRLTNAKEGRLDGTKRLEAKIDHLQRELNELDAYREALAEFIDEHGRGDDLLEEFHSTIEAQNDRIRALESTMETTQNHIDQVDASLDSIDSRIDALRTNVQELEEVTEGIEHLRDEFEDLESRSADERQALATKLSTIDRKLDHATASLERELSAVSEDVQVGKQWRASLGQALSGQDIDD